jgi:hypothetical protein
MCQVLVLLRSDLSSIGCSVRPGALTRRQALPL